MRNILETVENINAINWMADELAARELENAMFPALKAVFLRVLGANFSVVAALKIAKR
jgi:hypothetical protein